mmetsp:Transcript_141268/g.316754  ORF Transcript_141268/g.316754 Transcript_141268/m.316754 type:complete len:215 (-) Transcript_141268:5-649(-)
MTGRKAVVGGILACVPNTLRPMRLGAVSAPTNCSQHPYHLRLRKILLYRARNIPEDLFRSAFYLLEKRHEHQLEVDVSTLKHRRQRSWCPADGARGTPIHRKQQRQDSTEMGRCQLQLRCQRVSVAIHRDPLLSLQAPSGDALVVGDNPQHGPVGCCELRAILPAPWQPRGASSPRNASQQRAQGFRRGLHAHYCGHAAGDANGVCARGLHGEQ